MSTCTSGGLLAILLGSGVQGKDVRKLAKEIISLLD